MAKREWGWICPEDGGLLMTRDDWARRGVAWCPNSDAHGGNGRFYRMQEVEEGWYDPTRPAAPSEAYAERLRQQEERNRESGERRMAAEAANLEKEKRKMAEKATPKTKTAATPRDCQCGCGGQTKGGRFIPGHDARFHSRVRSLEAQGVSHEEAEKIASKGPLTGKYAAAATAAKKATAPKATEAPVTAVPKPSSKGKRGKTPAAPESTEEAPIEV